MYNLTLINLDTLVLSNLLNTSSKAMLIAKLVTYLTELGLTESTVVISHKDGVYCLMFYHPTLNAFCVLKLSKI